MAISDIPVSAPPVKIMRFPRIIPKINSPRITGCLIFLDRNLPSPAAMSIARRAGKNEMGSSNIKKNKLFYLLKKCLPKGFRALLQTRDIGLDNLPPQWAEGGKKLIFLISPKISDERSKESRFCQKGAI